MAPSLTKSLFVALSASALTGAEHNGTIRIPMKYNPSSFIRRGFDDTNVPMKGSAQRFGEYTVDIIVGGQLFTVMVDTGSSDLAIHSKGCHGCTVKINPPYDPSLSKAKPVDCHWCSSHRTEETQTSCRKVQKHDYKQCTFLLSYADTSGFSAALYHDSFTFADGVYGRPGLQVTTQIGAIYKADFPNPQMVDGIIGFADVQASGTGGMTPYMQMVADGKIKDVFSMCLRPHGDGGHIYLGTDGLSSNAVAGVEPQWTPMLRESGFYGVEITDVKVAGESLGLNKDIYNEGEAIVDSGSQEVNLPKTAYKAIKKAFAKLCKKGMCLKGVCNCKRKKVLTRPIFSGSKCAKLTPQDIEKYPMIEFEFSGNLTVQYAPQNYLKNGAAFCEGQTLDEYTIALSAQDDGEGTILGETFMMGYLVVHDRVNSRMGFEPVSPTNCPGVVAAPNTVIV